MRFGFTGIAAVGLLGAMLPGPASAETAMQQCGHQYQDAKAAGTLNGMSWSQFRSDCATRLKAQPASAGTAPVPPVATAASQTANPLNPAPAAPVAPTPAASPAPVAPVPAAPAAKDAAPAATGGRAAFLLREKQCGAEWRANKTTLVAQTPGLKWPKYLSQCNARLKAAAK